MGDILVLVGVA